MASRGWGLVAVPSLFGLDREMGYTRSEFFNQAPRTLKNHKFSLQPDRIVVSLKTGEVQILVGPERIRHITPAMRLPYIEVSIRFSHTPKDEQIEFMQLFDRSYQKGGG